MIIKPGIFNNALPSKVNQGVEVPLDQEIDQKELGEKKEKRKYTTIAHMEETALMEMQGKWDFIR